MLWKGRKSAFGAIARIKPDYYLHDAVVPRTRLLEVLRQVYEIAATHDLIVVNVFHAGDGNLHPILVFDAREPGVWDRVHGAGRAIMHACIAAGGVLSGEHGIGIEKRDFMPLVFNEEDLDAQARLRTRSIPTVAPTHRRSCPRAAGAARRCASRRARGCEPDRHAHPDDRRSSCGLGRRRGNAARGRRRGRCGCDGGARPVGGRRLRTRRHDRDRHGGDADQRSRRGVGGARAGVSARSAFRRCDGRWRAGLWPLGAIGGCAWDPVRDRVLEVRFITGDGRLVRGGGPTVKNVTGYDLPRLLVGSLGTLGVITQVTMRTLPLPLASSWAVSDATPDQLRALLFRPACLAWDGHQTHVLLEGHPDDIAMEQSRAGLVPVDRPPSRPDQEHRGRASVRPGALAALARRLDDTDCTWMAEGGRRHGARRRFDGGRSRRGAGGAEAEGGWLLREAGAPNLDPFGIALPSFDVSRRIKAAFDPFGKLNPGRLPFVASAA